MLMGTFQLFYIDYFPEIEEMGLFGLVVVVEEDEFVMIEEEGIDEAVPIFLLEVGEVLGYDLAVVAEGLHQGVFIVG